MNIFKQLFKSLYSPKDIASFRSQGIGKTILFVFLLSIVSVLPVIYYSNTAINSAIQITEEALKEDLPSFTIENGQLESPKEQPFTINKGEISIIFDSTGSIDVGNVSNTGDTLALLKHELVFSAGGKVHSFSYSMLANDKITKEDIEKLIRDSDSAVTVLLLLYSFFIFLFSSALKFVEVTILALVGLLIRNISRKPLEYRHLWRMTAYSITLSTVFFAIMSLLQTQVPFGSLISWFISLTVLLLAIQEVPTLNQQDPTKMNEE